MKYTWIFLVLALFSLYIGNFLYRNQSPWNKDKMNQELANENIKTNSEAIRYIQDTQELGLILEYVNIRNFLILFIFVDSAIICAFAAVHTFIDKLFFKKFYEDSSWQIALRRGVELACILDALIMLRLSASLSVFTLIPVLFIIIGMEYIFTGRMARKEKTVEK